MRRREFIVTLAGAALHPRSARAQSPCLPVVGFLTAGSFVTCGSAQGLEATFAAAKNAGAQALLVMADPLFSNWREHIVGLAAQHRLPTIYEANGSVQAGGLIGYGSSIADGFLQMGIYAAKILDGSKPRTCR